MLGPLTRARKGILVTLVVAYIALDVPRDGAVGQALISAIWVVALVLVGRLVWHGAGVRLSPDGIRDRRLFGQLFVPWDAVDPEHAPAVVRSFEVMPAYRRPELVRGRRTPISAWNVDGRFLARVIREYAGRPDFRPAIGTAAELDRLARENEPPRG